ncbi:MULTISPECIES: hypothetical protein [Moorena]|nr:MULTISPECIES: hypothetical protein [Moorena]
MLGNIALRARQKAKAMQRGLGGFPHERLHQDGKRQKFTITA